MINQLAALQAVADEAEPLQTSSQINWCLGETLPTSVPVLQKAMTLAISLKDLHTPGDLLVWKDPAARNVVRVHIGEVEKIPSLIVELSMDVRDTPLPLSAPIAAIGADFKHTLLVRYFGYGVELYVDGVLLDENWPYGTLLPPHGSMTISDSVEEITIWNRSVTDPELIALIGDKLALIARENQYLGEENPFGQYWRPRGLNTHVGDCMPFFHDGRFSLFYLIDRHGHGSKWWLGAHQWAHVSTTDLVHWESHPLAVGITDEKEGSICTGSTFFHAGKCYAFYAIRTNDGSPAQLCASTSDDGIHFTKNPPLAQLKEPYSAGPGRDPVVFAGPDGKFHMLVTTELANAPIAHRGGCLAELVSTDLQKWEQREPFLVPGYNDPPECPDYFEWHGWYYLLFSNNGMTRYRMSRNPLGPWVRPAVDAFDTVNARVMKTAAFTGDRRIGAVFLNTGTYGGDVVFREIVQNRDGTLSCKWPAEMVPATDAAVPLKFDSITAGASCSKDTVCIQAPQGLEAGGFRAGPKNFLLRARVTPAAGTSFFGVRFAATANMQGGTELRFEPMRAKAGLRSPDVAPGIENEITSIYNVAGLDKRFIFELLVKNDIADVCIDGRRTLLGRIELPKNPDLFFFAQNGDVVFDNIEWKPLTEFKRPSN